MGNWFVTTKRADFDRLAEKFHISPVISRIIRNRDICEDDEVDYFLNGTLEDLHDPRLLPQVQKGCEFVAERIRENCKIRIIGDYDIDGICATHILVDALRRAEADVDAAIPHRMRDGYGLSENLVRDAKDAGIDTIITCDNGIAAKDQIALAYEFGMHVVITDHHDVPFVEDGGERREVLPEAAAVIDPKMQESQYPFEGICGAVVAYKFAQVLLEDYIGLAKDEVADYLAENLPFAAIATVGDVMNLLDENRILVREGLKAIQGSDNNGLKALLAVLELTDKAIGVYHIGFIIGPCINATGRLDTAKRALRLFETTDYREAVLLATELKQLNEERKLMTEKFTEKAIEMIESRPISKVLVVFLPDCHESIAGIIAGRLKERYDRPTIVLTKAEEGVKGSGRSIEAYNMYEELHKVADLFTKFGGHPMAAGLSMATEGDVVSLRERLNAQTTLTEADFAKKVVIDVPMPIGYVSSAFIDEISYLEPFGTGNPKPLFAQKAVHLTDGRVLGKARKVAKFKCTDGAGHYFDAIYYGEADSMIAMVEAHQGICDIAYYPEFNEYKGEKSIQLVVKHYDFSR